MHRFKVAVDLDGVLADFARKVAEITNALPKNELAHIARIDESIIDKRKMWRAINEYNSHIPFFLSLDKMCDADLLMGYLMLNFPKEDIMILSASGTTPADAPEQKRAWVKRHFSEMFHGNILTEIVTKSSEKARFATPTTILIDDRAKSIDPWVDAGGIGILHTSSSSTIKELDRIIYGQVE